MAGVTFLAFGNGSPDVFSTFAAMNTNSGSLAVGELIGAAGFITAVVAGSMALVRPFKVAKKSFVRDVGFFIVAASFSMVFLYDGKLHLWECITMVVFYLFYVALVVVWHWWLGRRRRRREKEAAARGQFMMPGNEELDLQEEYHDEEDEETGGRPHASRGPSMDDFSALERGETPRIEVQDEDEEEEARDKWLGELSSNMRVSRAPGRRRNTLTPIRPSLVGALEFQSVLHSLSKSRSMQHIPLYSRRYSDDPVYQNTPQDQLSGTSDTAIQPHSAIEGTGGVSEGSRPSAGAVRARAVSANDATNLRIDPRFLAEEGKLTGKLVDITENDDDDNKLKPPSVHSMPGQTMVVDGDHAPMLSLSPAPIDDEHAPASAPAPGSHGSADLLAPPGSNFSFTPSYTDRYTDSPAPSPRASAQQLPKIKIPTPRGTPPSPFPTFSEPHSAASSRPPSLFLPPASISAQSQAFGARDEEDERPLKWWPYRVLPPPQVILSTLFPTLYTWRSKNWWEKILGLVSAPSVFLLTITLPVVEIEQDESEEDAAPGMSFPDPSRKPSGATHSPEIPYRDTPQAHRPSLFTDEHGIAGGGSTAGVATHVEGDHHHNHHLKIPDERTTLINPPPSASIAPPPSSAPSSAPATGPRSWNRWLTITQLFLAPLFTVCVIYTQYIPPEDGSLRPIAKAILIALLVSTVLLIPLLLTTTPTHRPKPYNTILSLAGFAVSIAWISTIAGQVVALLKAFAIILNMSHAILGLTVFAVGNSLGDLVADITVARLGYPVMALSACFGGPLLNILLGIGLSGTWILVRGAEHRHQKHPGKEIKFRSYEVEVSGTLIVSGITLLVTLVGLLIAVPLNKWVLSKKIGWALIALWCVSTVLNVVFEVLGVGEAKRDG